MADYWIKWYHEILDDPKMATLPDRLWRRFSELCLLAGKLCVDKSGKLPDTRQIAWALRMSTDDLAIDLAQLSAVGIIEPIPNGWIIVNFQKRQQAATTTERVRQHRERKQREQYYTPGETQLKRNVTQINRLTESETETETEKTTTSSGRDDDFATLIRAYEQNIGVISPVVADKVGADLDEYGLALCVDAITEAVRQNIRKWSYVQGVLRNWKTNGRTAPARKQDKTTHVPTTQLIELPGGQIVEAHT